MAKGGYRKPSGGPRASGVGKNSKRTDASQPIDVPNVQDSTELTQGDAQKLTAGMRQRPLGRASAPQIQRTGPLNPRSQAAELPQYLFDRPTDRALEPPTAGLPEGAGPGPEALRTAEDPSSDKEAALMMLMRLDTSGAPEALQNMLNDMRAERAPAPAPMGPVAPVAVPMDEEAPEMTEPDATEILLPEDTGAASEGEIGPTPTPLQTPSDGQS